MAELPPELESRVARLAADRTRGALELATEAVELLAAVGPGDPHFTSLAEALRRVRPAMVPIARAVEFLLAGPFEAQLAEARRVLAAAPRETAARVRARLGQGRRLVLLSRSSTVACAVAELAPARLFVLESRPGGEGLAEARRWAEQGYAVELVADLEMARAVREGEAVLLGVDAELPDGAILGKAGSWALALVARELERPVLALSHPFKVTAAPPPLEEWPPEKAFATLPPGVSVRCVPFERVPPGYVEIVRSDR